MLYALGFSAFLLLLLGLRLSSDGLWDPYEVRYLEQVSDPSNPIAGQPLWQPMAGNRARILFWPLALGSKLFGFNELGARLPMWVLAGLSVLSLAGFAAWQRRRWGAFLAPLLLATTPLFFMSARLASQALLPLLAQIWAVWGLAMLVSSGRGSRRLDVPVGLLLAAAGLVVGGFACGTPVGVGVPTGAVAMAWLLRDGGGAAEAEPEGWQRLLVPSLLGLAFGLSLLPLVRLIVEHSAASPGAPASNPTTLRLQIAAAGLVTAAAALLLAGAGPTAGRAAAQGLPAEIEAALQRARVPAEALGLVVQEIGARTPVVAHRAAVPMNPASVVKLLPSAAALDLLGPAWTWSTPVWLAGRVDASGVLDGSLHIKGSGDPKLVQERLWLLLRRVQQLGVREIRGDIVLDGSAFAVADGTPADFDGGATRPYNARPAALLLNYRAVIYTFTPDAAAGVARIGVEPPLAGFTVDRTVPLSTVVKLAGDHDGVVGREAGAVGRPVGRRNAHRDRQPRRPGGAHRRENLERVAHPILERAAVVVAAKVGERREEARQQIAMRHVELEPVEAGLRGPLGRSHEGVPDAFHFGAIHGALVVRKHFTDLRLPLLGQRDQATAPILRIRAATDKATRFEPIDSGGNRATGQLDAPTNGTHRLFPAMEQ